jgi:hypothetical protein
MALQTMADFSLFLRKSADGKNKRLGAVVELEKDTNRLFEVLPVRPCNQGSHEVVPVQGELPAVAWRLINKGSTPVLARFKSASFTCGSVQTICQTDEKLVELCGDEYHLAENKTHLAALGNKIAETFFYGDENVNPAGFTGLSAYYYDKTDPVWGNQIADAGGTGDALTSLWFVGFGAASIYGICPPSIPMGFQHHNNGLQTVTNEGTEFKAMENQYNWDMGLAVADPRKAARVINIDTTALTTSPMETFTKAVADAFYSVDPPTGDHARFVGFANKKLLAYIAKAHNLTGQGNMVSYAPFNGKPTLHYCGVPVLLCDSISSTESAI